MHEQLDHRVVTITKGLRGYFAVVMNIYQSGWSEPEISGIFASEYKTDPIILDEAKLLAKEYSCHIIL